MARRTAGRIVRNAASLGGNTMMVLKHIPKGTGEPFPSDLFTALVAVEARISYLVLEQNGEFEQRTGTAGRARRRGPEGPDARRPDRAYLLCAAAGRRRANLCSRRRSRSAKSTRTASSTRRRASRSRKKLTVDTATLVFGGIAPYPWRASKTEAAMVGKELTLASFGALSKILAKEVEAELNRWAERMKEVPDEGFTDGIPHRSSPFPSSTRRSSTRWSARASRCRIT